MCLYVSVSTGAGEEEERGAGQCWAAGDGVSERMKRKEKVMERSWSKEHNSGFTHTHTHTSVFTPLAWSRWLDVSWSKTFTSCVGVINRQEVEQLHRYAAVYTHYIPSSPLLFQFSQLPIQRKLTGVIFNLQKDTFGAQTGLNTKCGALVPRSLSLSLRLLVCVCLYPERSRMF